MRKVCCILGLLSGMLWLSGCKNESLLRPPKNAEVFNQPPDEPRYTKAPEIPKEYLNTDELAKRGAADANSNSGTPGSKLGGMRTGGP